jgi:hypothetical protein
MRPGIELSMYVIKLVLKKFQMLEHFGFQIFGLGMPTLFILSKDH